MKSIESIIAANAAERPGYSGSRESYIDKLTRGKYARNTMTAQLVELRHTTQMSRNGLQARICTYCGADEKQATLCNDPLCTMQEE